MTTDVQKYTSKGPSYQNEIGQVRNYAEIVRSDEFKHLGIEELLELCAINLRKADEQLRGLVHDVENTTDLQAELRNFMDNPPGPQVNTDQIQGEIATLEAELQAGGVLVPNAKGGSSRHIFTEAEKNEKRAKIDEKKNTLAQTNASNAENATKTNSLAEKLERAKNPEAANIVRNNANGLSSGDKDMKSAARKAIEGQIENLGSSREMKMLKLNSAVSQRAAMLEQISKIISKMNDTYQSITQK
jgi:hypothetical protein